MTDASEVLHKDFRITLVATREGFIARIRRIDGQQFLVARSLRAATATTPFPTAQAALAQAQAIIDRIGGG